MTLPLVHALMILLPNHRPIVVTEEGDRHLVEITMPAPLPAYAVHIIPGTWTAEQLAEGAQRWEAEAGHGLAMADVP